MRQTGDDGSYVVDGLGSGSYLVNAEKAGYATEYYNEKRWEEDATPVLVTEGQTAGGINFTLEAGGSICGTVRDADGDPIAAAHVYANPQDHAEPWWWSIAQAFLGWHQSATGSDGTYVVGDLGTGSYVVKASAEGYADRYYNAVAEREDADPVPVTEGHSSCSIDFVFGSDEPVLTPTPTPTQTATPTATRTPGPPVGGIADLPDAADSEGSSSSLLYAALAGATAVVSLSVGGWYARRRLRGR